MLIETTFDIPGGIAMLQSIVNEMQVPLEERIKAANTLLYNGVPAGYALMIQAFDGTNRAAHFAAENLLLTYNNYLANLQQAATNGTPQVAMLNGTPVNLLEVITHIKHKMRMPFVTNNIVMAAGAENCGPCSSDLSNTTRSNEASQESSCF
jgi:hypothetical protein